MPKLKVVPYQPHTEWKREDRPVKLVLFVFYTTSAILAISVLLWSGNKIGDVIDHLGRMPK